MKDSQFATQLMVIMGILVALTIFLIILANTLIPDADYSEDAVVRSNIEDRIEPIGKISTTDSPAQAAATVAAAATSTAGDANLSAEQLYAPCGACHAAGVLDAPKYGDKSGWQDRISKGVDALYNSAINGIGAMPAKGGRADYSDDDIKKIVDYMLESVQ